MEPFCPFFLLCWIFFGKEIKLPLHKINPLSLISSQGERKEEKAVGIKLLLLLLTTIATRTRTLEKVKSKILFRQQKEDTFDFDFLPSFEIIIFISQFSNCKH